MNLYAVTITSPFGSIMSCNPSDLPLPFPACAAIEGRVDAFAMKLAARAQTQLAMNANPGTEGATTPYTRLTFGILTAGLLLVVALAGAGQAAAAADSPVGQIPLREGPCGRPGRCRS